MSEKSNELRELALQESFEKGWNGYHDTWVEAFRRGYDAASELRIQIDKALDKPTFIRIERNGVVIVSGYLNDNMKEAK